MKRPSRVFLACAFGSVLSGCGSSFKQVPRGNDFVIVYEVDKIYPHVARAVSIGLDASFALRRDVEATAVRFGYQTEVHQLYEQLNQINGLTRTLIVAGYTGYINAELDGDSGLRQRGRDEWSNLTRYIADQAYQTQAIAEGLRRVNEEPENGREIIERLNEQADEALQAIMTHPSLMTP